MDLDAAPATGMGGVKRAVSGVRVADVNSGAKETLDCTALFVAIGHLPNTGILEATGIAFSEAHPGYLSTVAGTSQQPVNYDGE